MRSSAGDCGGAILEVALALLLLHRAVAGVVDHARPTLRGAGDHHLLDDLLEVRGGGPHRAGARDAAQAAEAAEHGAGVALVSSHLANERFAQGTLTKVVDAELHTGESYYLILRCEDEQREDLQALTRWIVREFSTAA